MVVLRPSLIGRYTLYMIFLIPKLLLLFGLPIVITIFWHRRVNAHWNILLVVFGAFAVNYLLQRFFGPVLTLLVERIIPPIAPPFRMEFYPPWIVFYFISGLWREGIRWLLLRYVATSVRSWQNGIMFGIAYGSIVMLIVMGNVLFGFLKDMGLFMSTFELLVAGRSRPSLNEIVETLNSDFFWWRTLFLTWTWGVSSMIFNVGTCLAVVLSVQRRAVLPFLAAVVLYVLYSNARAVITHSSFVDTRLGWLHSSFSIAFFVELGVFIFALPCLLLIFLLRKPMTNDVSS